MSIPLKLELPYSSKGKPYDLDRRRWEILKLLPAQEVMVNHPIGTTL